MNHLHDRQQTILNYLLESPDGATVDQLLPIIGVTKTAVKEHLNQLQHMGYLSFRDVSTGVGRPKRMYVLSDQGTESFPRQYSWLSSALLNQLALDLDSKQISKIMKSIAKSVAESLEPKLSRLSDQERLIQIVKTMNDLGYRARLRPNAASGATVIEAMNCVYHSVAKVHPKLCEFDIEFLSASSKKRVKMESCVARGGSSCRFCLSQHSK